MGKKFTLAMFDFDGTMFHGDSIVLFVRFARKQGFMTLFEFLRSALFGALAYLHIINDIRAKNAALSFLKYMKKTDRNAFCKRFSSEILLPAVYPKALRRMKEHAQKGHIVLLVTASPECYMRYAAQALPVRALLATYADDDCVIRENCKGENKVKRVREWLTQEGLEPDLPGSYAYGDSLSDLPLLTLAGHPVPVEPARSLAGRFTGVPAEYWRE